ncbi:MAG: glycine oxidase ThiO [Rhizomicrobium sp.]|jgi:glycine oxidase
MNVVIIGAGVAGLGIGWKLAKAGASVTILERAQAGRGATTASGGMIAAAAELGQADTPLAAFASRSNALWPGFVTQIEAQSGISVDFRKNGSLMVALKSGGCPHAHGGEHPTASGGQPNPHAQGSDIAMLTAEQARAMEPMLSEDIAGALWAPHEAQIDTHALVRALATAFAKAGGKLLPNETAVRIEIEDGRAVSVRTPFTLHRADAYVLAAGAWTSRVEGLPPEAVPPVIPIKGEIVVLTPPAGAALPKHVVWGNEIYVVPRTGRLLVGATVERAGFDTGKSPEAYRWLLRQSAGLIPALESWEVAEHWVGLRPATPDGLPILGPTVVEGLYVASGQYRNGILFAPAVAEVMSRLVLERVMDVPAFDPRRFDGVKPHAPDFVIETAHRAHGKDSGS